MLNRFSLKNKLKKIICQAWFMYISLPICALTRRRYRKTPPLSSAPFTRHPCSWLGIALRVGLPVRFVSQENPRASAWKHLRQRTDGAVISDNCEHVFPPTASVCVCALLAIQTSAPVYTLGWVFVWMREWERKGETEEIHVFMFFSGLLAATGQTHRVIMD